MYFKKQKASNKSRQNPPVTQNPFVSRPFRIQSPSKQVPHQTQIQSPQVQKEKTNNYETCFFDASIFRPDVVQRQSIDPWYNLKLNSLIQASNLNQTVPNKVEIPQQQKIIDVQQKSHNEVIQRTASIQNVPLKAEDITEEISNQLQHESLIWLLECISEPSTNYDFDDTTQIINYINHETVPEGIPRITWNEGHQQNFTEQTGANTLLEQYYPSSGYPYSGYDTYYQNIGYPSLESYSQNPVAPTTKGQEAQELYQQWSTGNLSRLRKAATEQIEAEKPTPAKRYEDTTNQELSEISGSTLALIAQMIQQLVTQKYRQEYNKPNPTLVVVTAMVRSQGKNILLVAGNGNETDMEQVSGILQNVVEKDIEVEGVDEVQDVSSFDAMEEKAEERVRNSNTRKNRNPLGWVWHGEQKLTNYVKSQLPEARKSLQVLGIAHSHGPCTPETSGVGSQLCDDYLKRKSEKNKSVNLTETQPEASIAAHWFEKAKNQHYEPSTNLLEGKSSKQQSSSLENLTYETEVTSYGEGERKRQIDSSEKNEGMKNEKEVAKQSNPKKIKKEESSKNEKEKDLNDE